MTSTGKMFVDELPKTATGKIQKNVLRDRYWQGRDRLVNEQGRDPFGKEKGGLGPMGEPDHLNRNPRFNGDGISRIKDNEARANTAFGFDDCGKD